MHLVYRGFHGFEGRPATPQGEKKPKAKSMSLLKLFQKECGRLRIPIFFFLAQEMGVIPFA